METSSPPGLMLEKRNDNVLPLVPVVTPAWGIAGAFLIITGLAYGLVGIRNRWILIRCRCNRLQTFLSSAYLTSIGVTVLIIYVMHPPISDAVQGAFFVAACVSGLIVGGFSLLLEGMCEGFGCLLGGFCLSMWLMTLRAGGLTQSSSGTATFISVLSIAVYLLSFIPRIKSSALIVCSSFAGATATVLGVDCFSEAGLKEFWAYIWGVNKELFPIDTNTYPLTKGIRAETGCIAVLFIFGLMSQFKIWQGIKKDRDKTAAEDARLEEDREKTESDVGRRVQKTIDRDLGIWEATYGEKKPAKVSQSPPFPRAHKRLDSKTVLLSKRQASGSDGIQEARNKVDDTNEITQPHVAVREASDESTETPRDPVCGSEAQRHSMSLKKDYPRLRPASGPPRPVLPPSSVPNVDSADEADYAAKVESVEHSPAVSESPPLNVSSLDLAIDDLLDHPSADINLIDEKNVPCVELTPVSDDRNPVPSLQENEEEIFDFERIPSDDEADRNSIQNSRIASQDTENVRPELEQTPNPRKQPSSSRGGIKQRGVEELPRRITKAAAMDRTNAWAKMLDEAEDPEPGLEQHNGDARLAGASDANDVHDQAKSLWSGFEGTHTNTTTTMTEAHPGGISAVKMPTEPQAIAKVATPSQSRPIKQEERKSRNALPMSDRAPVMMPPVKSARLHKRISSLPAITTTQRVPAKQEAASADRRWQPQTYQTSSSSRSSMQQSSRTPDDMTLSERRASLQQARRMSSEQGSTASSSGPYSTMTQSPAATTARTTPMASSPAHPPFAMAAHPLYGNYPTPPYEHSNKPRRASNPASQPNSTLIGVIEQNEQHRQQIQQQQRASRVQDKDRKSLESRLRRMEIEEAMRRGLYEEAHREKLRQMQSVATKNAEARR